MQINNRIETNSIFKLNKQCKNKRYEIIFEVILQKRKGFMRYIPVTIHNILPPEKDRNMGRAAFNIRLRTFQIVDF